MPPCPKTYPALTDFLRIRHTGDILIQICQTEGFEGLTARFVKAAETKDVITQLWQIHEFNLRAGDPMEWVECWRNKLRELECPISLQEPSHIRPSDQENLAGFLRRMETIVQAGKALAQATLDDLTRADFDFIETRNRIFRTLYEAGGDFHPNAMLPIMFTEVELFDHPKALSEIDAHAKRLEVQLIIEGLPHIDACNPYQVMGVGFDPL